MGPVGDTVRVARTLIDDVGSLGALRSLTRATEPTVTQGLASTAAHAQVDDLLLHGDAAGGSLLPTTGNRFELLEGTDAFATRLIDDIGAAKHHIHLTEFAIHHGAPGGAVSDRVLTAIRDRAGDGLPVTMQLDGLGSGFALGKRPATEMATWLRAGGVEVRVKPLTLSRSGLDDARLATDHRKVFEIDGRVTYQGGVNLVDEWAPWHDLMLRGEGPIAAQSGALLAARWRDLGGTVSDVRAAILHAGLDAPVADAGSSALQLSNGNRARRELTQHFMDSADGAQSRLWITNPYYGDARVMGKVVDAAKRGVDVRLLLTPKAGGGVQRQDAFTDPLRRSWAYTVHAAGGTIDQTSSFSHAKAWIADDVATVGSFNLDRSSTRRNYENAIATNDPGTVAQLEHMFERQRTRGVTLDSDSVAGWQHLARARELLHIEY